MLFIDSLVTGLQQGSVKCTLSRVVDAIGLLQ